MTPCLLALDTATESLAVALLTPAGRWHLDAPGGPVASAELLPAVQRLLAQAGVAIGALDAIAFGQGPGAFTGLRTACAAAQGLGLGTGKPLLAIDSLAIVAEAAAHAGPALPAGQPIWVAMDARMDEVYAACYCRRPQAAGAALDWQVHSPPQLYTLAALARRWQAQPPQVVAGSAVTAFDNRLPWQGARLIAPPVARAAALLRLAQAAWATGQAVPADQAVPLYLRDKVALTSDERAALKPAVA